MNTDIKFLHSSEKTPQKTEKSLAIGIINYNTCNELLNCLDSIYQNEYNHPLEVWVVDNASHDGSIEQVRLRYPEVNLIANKKNLGYAGAVNQFVHQSTSELLLILNSDTILFKSTLDSTVNFLRNTPDAGFVGCKVLNLDGSIQPSCRGFPNLRNFISENFYLYRIFPRIPAFGQVFMTHFDYQTVKTVDVILGAFMMVSRSVINQIGPMDDRFFMYSEETDWCYRAQRAGFKNYFYPNAHIIHLGEQSTRQNSISMFLELHKSHIRYVKKYHGSLYCTLVEFLLFAGVVLRLLINTAGSLTYPSDSVKKKQFQRDMHRYATIFKWYIKNPFNSKSKQHKTTKAKKIIQFDISGRGGISHFIYFLTTALKQLDRNIELVTTRENELFSKMIFPVHPILKPHYRVQSFWKKGGLYLLSLIRLSRCIHKYHPDLVHWHEIKIPAIETVLLRYFQKRGIKFILSAHDVMHFERGKVTSSLYRLYHQFDHIIAHAENNRKILLDQFNTNPKKISVIPHGEYSHLTNHIPAKKDARNQLGIPSHKRVALFMGYIRHYKGLDLLLKAVAKAKPQLSDIFLIIAGEEKENFNIYQKQIDELNLKDSVLTDIRYIPIGQLSLYLAAADIVTLPYRQIYQSGILYLAFGAKRPVIASSVGGLIEVVQSGKNGFLCKAEDSDDLAQTLIRALQNIEALEKMGEYAYIHSKQEYSWKSIAKQIGRIYDKLLTKDCGCFPLSDFGSVPS